MRLYTGKLILAVSLTLLPILGFPQDHNNSTKVEFQVISDQLIFDNTLIKHASFIENKDKTSGDLVIELKSSASQDLTRITAAAIGKQANLVINNKIVTSATIRSPLQKQFLVKNISKEDAQKFINSLDE